MDRPNHPEKHEGSAHARDVSRANAEEHTSFIEKSLRGEKLLGDNFKLTKATDGRNFVYDKTSHEEKQLDPKSIREEFKKEGVVQYEQIKYNMMKHAIAEAVKSDVANPDAVRLDFKHIKEVQRVEDGYAYKYDLDDKGIQDGKLLLTNEKHSQLIRTFEKDMADYGFAIEQPMSESIKKAVLKNAAETAATPEEKKMLENGAVQSYDVEHEKWYISKNGKIEEFSLDNKKIEDMSGTKINPDSHVTVVESKETSAEAQVRETDKLIDKLKDDRDHLEKWAKRRGTLLHIAMFANQGAAQASQNLDAVEQALQLGGGSSGMQPATIQSSDKVFRSIEERHRNKIKVIEKKIEHLEKLKVNVENPTKKLAEAIKEHKPPNK